jgi:hypothetical protein
MGFLDNAAHPQPREHRVTATDQRAVKAVALIVAPMALGLAALGGLGSFATVRQAAYPYFSAPTPSAAERRSANAALGRRLREQGFAIANGRIAEFAALARDDAAGWRV